MKHTLMHICCAPCANQPIALLRSEGISVAGFWFNPNIHPYTEYQARKHTLEEYAKEIQLKLVIGGTYDLRSFITHVVDNIDGRCAYCYWVRMDETARYAAEHGYDSFTTSLLISPYQNHEAIRATAQAMGEKYGVEFPMIRFRAMVSRWGSSQPRRKVLTFNRRLIEMPKICIEYVVLHEFVHFLQADHSRRFYALMTMFMPDWKKRAQLLEKEGIFGIEV